MRWAFATVFLAGISVSACDNDENEQQPPPQEELQFERSDLVSDLPGRAAVTDTNLINPWGLAFGPDTFLWVANAGSGTLTVYDAAGTPQPQGNPLVVTAPSEVAPGEEAPELTGMVFNPTDGFVITATTTGIPLQQVSAPARFMAARTDGSIVGWSPAVLGTLTVTAVPAEEGDAYTGLAFANDGERGDLLYASNFPRREIEVFDTHFENVDLGAGAFEDGGSPAIPDDYGPFSVHAIGGRIYVAYAQIDPATTDEVAGLGKGYVSIFETNGTFERRLVSQGDLDAPWGIAKAPASFGRLGGTILVGNFGDGRIHAYNSDTGALVDAVLDANKSPIAIEGLWSIEFGNGVMAGATNELFFTAGVEDETHGLFGDIRPIMR